MNKLHYNAKQVIPGNKKENHVMKTSFFAIFKGFSQLHGKNSNAYRGQPCNHIVPGELPTWKFET